MEFIEKDKLIGINLEKETITFFEMTQFKRQIPFFTAELRKEENAIEENDD